MSRIMMSWLDAWLLTVAVHTSVLLLLAWLSERWLSVPRAWRELLWRCALFGGAITASLQPIAGMSPLAGSWSISALSSPAEDHSQMRSTATRPLNTEVDARASADAAQPSASVPARSNALSAATFNASADPSAQRWIIRRLAPQAVTIILIVWLLGTLLALTRLLLGLLSLRRMLRDASALTESETQHDLSALAQSANLPTPQLYRLNNIASPLAIMPARIVMPAWALDTLDIDQRRAMLAHELAHVARRDPQWKLLTATWRALFWFVPLGALAQRRLDELAELACDAFAAQHTGSARSVAECLASCAEYRGYGAPPRLAAAMAARNSSFIHRIDCLLAGVSMQPTTLSLPSRAAAVVVLIGTGLMLPTITLLQPEIAHAVTTQAPPPVPTQPTPPQRPQPPAASDTSTSSSVSISDDDGSQNISIAVRDDGHSFNAQVSGKIMFGADDSDVASLSDGGTANFEEQRNGTVHRLELSARAGKLERRYFVDKHEQPFDSAASAWLADFLPTLIRESAIGAAARGQRIYARGGAPAVLDEAQRIHSDYARGIYLDALLDRGQLDPITLDRAIRLAGGFGSDYARGQGLSHIFAKQSLSTRQQVSFLQQVRHFNSDYERAELLIRVQPKLADDSEVQQIWLYAALGLSSDYEKQRTLHSLLTHGHVDDNALAILIEATTSISSDYERSQLLIEIAKHARDVDAIAPAYTKSAAGMGADYERRQTLLALIHAGKLNARSSEAILDSAAYFGSDYDCREVLVALARAMPDDTALLTRYRNVAAHLSDYERAQAEHALAR